MVDKKILCLGLIILTIVLIIIYRNKLVKSYESFVCAIDNDTTTHLDEYYNRCINEYKIEERGGSVPSPINDNSKRELIRYYLNQNDKINDHNNYSQFGKIPGTNRGWMNQVNKRSIMPEWAYYLFKIQLYNSSNPKNSIDFINNIGDFNHYNQFPPTQNYMNDFAGDRFDKSEKEIHKYLLGHFLSRIQRADKNEHPGTKVDLVWGIPYLKIKDESNKYTSITGKQNIPNFNYCYQIMFKGKGNVNNKYLVYEGDSLSVTEGNNGNSTSGNTATATATIIGVDTDAIVPNNTNSYFEITSAEDCNQYLKIKKHNSDKFIRTDSSTAERGPGLKLGGDDGINTKIIVSPKQEIGDLGIDIDTVFTLNTNGLTKEGVPTNVFFNSGKGSDNWLSFLSLNGQHNLQVSNKSYADLDLPERAQDITIDDVPLIKDNNNENFLENYEGIVFIRTNKLIDEDEYAYQEIRQPKPIGTKGDGIIQDAGLLKVIDRENPNAGFLNSGEEVTTNQKIFPVVNDTEVLNNNSKSLRDQCKYTGTLTNIKDIKEVCGVDSRCYGIYKEDGNNQKMAYVGEDCQRDMKYFDKYSNNLDVRLDRGKVNCYAIGESVDNTTTKICSLPKHHTKEQDNSLVSLQPAKKFSDPNYCQANLDYGRLDGDNPFSMYVNNPSCQGIYELEGAPLNDETCDIDEKCTFNRFSPEDEAFLFNSDFGKLINQNIELRKKLNNLDNKISNYENELEQKNDNTESYNAELTNQLNDFKIIKMNDILNNFNYHTVNELVDTHK